VIAEKVDAASLILNIGSTYAFWRGVCISRCMLFHPVPLLPVVTTPLLLPPPLQGHVGLWLLPPQLAALPFREAKARPSTQGATHRAVMLAALPFTHHSQLCCDCIAVQAHGPHLVAVGSYELLSEAAPSGGDAAVAGGNQAGVGGQMRAGAVDFFQVEGDALRLVHRVPCAAGTLFSRHCQLHLILTFRFSF
jgi:hypothetical protein